MMSPDRKPNEHTGRDGVSLGVIGSFSPAPLSEARVEIFDSLGFFIKEMENSPALRMTAATIHSVCSVLVKGNLTVQDFASRFLTTMENFPIGKDVISRIITQDLGDAECELQKSLELTLIVSLMTKDPESINNALFCIGRFLSKGTYSNVAEIADPNFRGIFDYEDFVEEIRLGQLVNLKKILTVAIMEDPELLISVGYHLQEMPEFQSELCQELLWGLVARNTLNLSEIKLAQILSGDAVALIKKLRDRYEIRDGSDQDILRQKLEDADTSDLDFDTNPDLMELEDEALSETTKLACLVFALKLEHSLACFHARHGSLALAYDHLQATEEQSEIADLSSLLIARFSTLSRNPLVPEAILYDQNFLTAEGDFAFQEQFIKRLLQLRSFDRVDQYMKNQEHAGEEDFIKSPVLISTYANFVKAYLPINQLKASKYLDLLFDIKASMSDSNLFFQEVFANVEDSLHFKLVQDRFIAEIRWAKGDFKQKIASGPFSCLFRELVASERFQEAEDLGSFLSGFAKNKTDLSRNLVDAYLDASQKLCAQGKLDSAMLALEEAMRTAKISIAEPKLIAKEISLASDYSRQVCKILRIAIGVGKDDLACKLLEQIKKAFPFLRREGIAPELAANFHQIVAEGYFDYYGYSNSLPLKTFFRLCNDPEYFYSLRNTPPWSH